MFLTRASIPVFEHRREAVGEHQPKLDTAKARMASRPSTPAALRAQGEPACNISRVERVEVATPLRSSEERAVHGSRSGVGRTVGAGLSLSLRPRTGRWESPEHRTTPDRSVVAGRLSASRRLLLLLASSNVISIQR